MSKYDKDKMETILKQMLGDEFITAFTADLFQIGKIHVFVKTVNDFIWCERFPEDDPAYDYLTELGYIDILIIAAREIRSE